jgi:hypothetical protein
LDYGGTKMSSSTWHLRLTLLATFFLAFVSLAAAQDYRGKVQGYCKDENGGAIVGATVVLRNVKTGVEVTRQADSEGRFLFDFVEPGDYILTAEQSGFKKAACKPSTVCSHTQRPLLWRRPG